MIEAIVIDDGPRVVPLGGEFERGLRVDIDGMGAIFVLAFILSVVAVREEHGSTILFNVLPWVKLILTSLKLDGF